jgi:hypothetical protein
MEKPDGARQRIDAGEVIPGGMFLEACSIYPELPQGQAVARLLVERAMAKAAPMLAEGVYWGGLHARSAGELVEQLVELMCYRGKSSLTVRLGLDDLEGDCDHIYLEVVEVG